MTGAYKITAPISGRISQAAIKIGNFRPFRRYHADCDDQSDAPIYVTFTVPQRNLPELRLAMAETGAAAVGAVIRATSGAPAGPSR